MNIIEVLNSQDVQYKQVGDNLVFDCPYCGARKKMEYSFTKDCFHCWVCDAKGRLSKLAYFYGINTNTRFERMSGYEQSIVRRRHDYIAPYTIRFRVNKIVLDTCVLLEADKNRLLQRGLTEAEIKRLGYKSYPDSNTIKKIIKTLDEEGLSPKGVPGFYMNNDRYVMPRDEGILIPVRSINGNIIAFQIRHNKCQKGERKYTWLSTNPEKVTNGKQKYPMGTKSETFVHFNFNGARNAKSFFITEGPIKADILALKKHVNVIAVPGVNSYKKLTQSLEYIKKHYNFSFVHELFDMDKLINLNVQRGIDKIKDLCVLQGYQWVDSHWDYKIEDNNYVWKGNYKGIDDWITKT